MIKSFLFSYSFFVVFSLSCSAQNGRHHPYKKNNSLQHVPFSEKAPLFIAISRHDSPKIIKALIDLGNNPNIHEPFHNDTLLIKAADKGKTKIIQFLLEQEVDINACNNYGQNIAWAIAQSYRLCIPVKLDLMKKIAAKGVNLRQRNQWGKTLLHVIDEPQLLEYIIPQIPELINAKDQDGNTPLHDAQTFNKKSILDLLLKKDADPSIKSNSRVA